MKIHSTLPEFPDHVYRRVVSWCCREIGLPVGKLSRATLAKSRNKYGGLAQYYYRDGTIGVRVTPSRLYDPLLCLVRVTAHEVAHVHLYVSRSTNNERSAEWFSWQVAVAFQADREQLTAEWFIPVRERAKQPIVSMVQKRADKATAMLAKWERKAKLAKTKVQQYRRKVNYYAKTAAKRSWRKAPLNLGVDPEAGTGHDE